MDKHWTELGKQRTQWTQSHWSTHAPASRTPEVGGGWTGGAEITLFLLNVPSLTLTRELCIFRLDGGPLRVRLPVTTHNTNYISSSQLPPSPLSDSGEKIHKLFILQNTEYLQNTQNVLWKKAMRQWVYDMLHLYWYTSNVHISQVSVVYVCKICPTWVDVNDLCLVNYYTCKKLHCNNQSFFHHFLKISVKYWLCPICADSSGRTSSFRVKYPNTSGHHNNHGDEDEVEDDDEDAGTLVIKEEYPEGGSVHGAQESSPPTTCK